jgi:hypothetical protein
MVDAEEKPREPRQEYNTFVVPDCSFFLGGARDMQGGI